MLVFGLKPFRLSANFSRLNRRLHIKFLLWDDFKFCFRLLLLLVAFKFFLELSLEILLDLVNRFKGLCFGLQSDWL